MRPERPQRLSKLLLFAMFAYAASHLDPLQRLSGAVEDPAAEYARFARMLLDTVYHESRSSTVQALILLGIREFGIGELQKRGSLIVCGAEIEPFVQRVSKRGGCISVSATALASAY